MRAGPEVPVTTADAFLPRLARKVHDAVSGREDS